MSQGEANTVGKQHFTSLYNRAFEQALTSWNIKSGWSKTGLYLLNPKRVLRDIQKPVAEPYVPKNVVKVEFRLKDGVPPTPVTSEALTSLPRQIGYDDCSSDEQSKHRVQNFSNAAQKAFAERALLLDENRFLFEQNNESTCRQSARSRVVDKAKVMSYEDIRGAHALDY